MAEDLCIEGCKNNIVQVEACNQIFDLSLVVGMINLPLRMIIIDCIDEVIES